jgi:hypothetical protein
MVDYRLRNFWTIARAIRQGNLTLIKTMEVLSFKNDLAGRQAALFVHEQQLKSGT